MTVSTSHTTARAAPAPSHRAAIAQRRRFERWPDRALALIGTLTVFAAWWSLIRLVVHHNRVFEHVDDVFALVNLPVGPSLFSVVLLCIVAGAVRRRMRAAWWLLLGFQAVSLTYNTVVITGLSGIDNLPGGPNTAATVATSANVILTALAVVALLMCRAAFTSHGPPRVGGGAFAVLITGLALDILITVSLTLAAPDHLSDTNHRLIWALRGVVGVRPDRTEIGWAGEYGHPWIALLAGLISGLTLIASAVLFVRSARAKEYISAQDELTLRGLLARDGERDSLGYFATRRDKAVVFAPNRNAAVTYRVVANVSLASADPIGDPAHWAEAISAWLAEARCHGWYPAVLAASEQAAHVYIAAGLKAIPMGDEAIIDTDTFSLNGPAMQPVRRAARRIRRLGYTITVHRHDDLSSEQLAELDECAERWRVDDTERGFSMALGRIGEPLDGRSVAVLAHDEDGRLRGLLSLVPWGKYGVSLDLMRRDRASDNGLNEAMVAALVKHGRDDLGIAKISLNFAMFRGVFSAAERVGARPMVRLTCRLMRFAGRFWQIESLYRSNARFQPRWETRYLCYDSALSLTRVSVAAGVAEGFLPSFSGRHEARTADDPVAFGGVPMTLGEAVARQNAQVQNHAAPARRASQHEKARVAKIALMREHGLDPYPVRVPRDTTIRQLRAECHPAAGEHTGRTVSVVGRVRAIRDFGGLTFVVLDEDGTTVQVMMSIDTLGQRQQLARRVLDIGDVLSVTGEVVGSAAGETSVQATDWRVAAKCLTPLPALRSATTHAPAYRRRQVELIVDHDARRLLTSRCAAVAALRETLTRHEYIEVETPMLQVVHGGAAARPFVTRLNAYDMPMFLRIAPELHLKRLCVGGFERVFELNRNFRNEGIDDTHNPEFTSLEVYRAHADYGDMEELARELILAAAVAVHGAPVARRSNADGSVVEVDLSRSWPRVRVHDAVSLACGRAISPDTSVVELRALCRLHEVAVRADATAGDLVLALYETLVEAHTVAPTFYYDFPIATSPLTRRHRDDPRLAERWDLVGWGSEIGTAYSELTDPQDQRARLVEQSLRRASGDVEAMQLDEDFLVSLSYGMPPTGGLGLGVDRVVMMLTGATIKQTLAFPFPTRGASEVG